MSNGAASGLSSAIFEASPPTALRVAEALPLCFNLEVAEAPPRCFNILTGALQIPFITPLNHAGRHHQERPLPADQREAEIRTTVTTRAGTTAKVLIKENTTENPP